MKFGKDEIQKIFLGLLLLIGLLYCYFNLMLGPLDRQEAGSLEAIKALEPQIHDAQNQRKKTENVEARAPMATKTLEQIKALIPAGAPIAWFPPKIADFFKRQGIDKVATRLNSEAPDKDLPSFRRLSWGIELQRVEFVSLASAVASLENEEPLLEVTNVQVESNPADPQ